MHKLQRRTSTILILVVLVAIAIAGATGIFIYARTHGGNCEPTAAMKQSGQYDVPCSVGFIVKDGTSPARVDELVQAVDGKMDKNFAEINTYYITVPPRTEQKAKDYLSNQPEVTSTFRDHCCAQPS